MKNKNSYRKAFVTQIAVITVLTINIFLLSTDIIAQENKNPTQLNNSDRILPQTPADYPSFSHDRHSADMGFSSWIASQIKYPSKALKENIQGWVHVAYMVEPDGKISNIKINAAPNAELGEEVVKVVKSCPKWLPSNNKEKTFTLKSSISIKFEIPQKILSSQDIPIFALGEVPFELCQELHMSLDDMQMPQFPLATNSSFEANDAAISKWVEQHLKYPTKAIKEKAEGTVVVRFIITKSGKLEDFTVVKTIHPLLDAETLRVLSLMPDWKPAMQGGEPKDVFYYADVNFKLPK